MKPWKVLNSSYLLKRWWMNLRVDHVQLANGTELTEFHVVEYPDWVCALCFTEGGRVVLVEQYRHGIGQMSVELPAGAIDADEEPPEAAKRELLEETGYVSDEWVYLGRCAPEPSKHTNWAYCYVALNGKQVAEQNLDDSESMAVRLYEPQEVLELADAGGIVHGTQLAAVFWARHRGFFDR